MAAYRLFVPKQAAGTSVVFFDLFNASGSAQKIQVISCLPVVSGEVAIVGVTAVDLFLTRTTAVGTGGTAATMNGSSLTACTFTSLDNSQPVNGNLTARLTPTGGATAGAVISTRSVFTEETNAGSYVPAVDMVRPWVNDLYGIVVPEGTGIRVVQGGVASLGNIAFDVIFNVYQN